MKEMAKVTDDTKISFLKEVYTHVYMYITLSLYESHDIVRIMCCYQIIHTQSCIYILYISESR